MQWRTYGRSKFIGYEKRRIDNTLAGLCVEDPSATPDVCHFSDLIYLPGRTILYDPAGQPIIETARSYLPADLLSLDAWASRKEKMHTEYAVDEPIEVQDIVEHDVLFGGFFVAHYGHFLIESLSRLWALDVFPDHDLFFPSRANAQPVDFPYARISLEALGLDPESLTTPRRPTLFRRLVCPIPSIQYANRIFHQHAQTAERVAEALDIRPTRDSDRIFLSRSRLGAGFRLSAQEADLEAALARFGYVVVHPETMAFPDQIRMFSSRRQIVGNMGSAFHTSLLAAKGSESTLCMFGWSEILDGRYILVDAVKEHQTYYLNGSDGFSTDERGGALDYILNVERTLDYMRDARLL